MNSVNCNGTKDILVRVRWLQWHEEGGKRASGRRDREQATLFSEVFRHIIPTVPDTLSSQSGRYSPNGYHMTKGPCLPPFRFVRDDELGQIRVENGSSEQRPMDQRTTHQGRVGSGEGLISPAGGRDGEMGTRLMGFAITEQLSWPVHRREAILVLQPAPF